MLGSATVVKSGSGNEWLLTLRNSSGREILTLSYPSMPKARNAANVLMSATWLVTAK